MPVSQQYESQGCGTGKRWGQQGEEEGVCVCVCVSMQMVPNLQFFNFTMAWKCYTFNRNCTSNSEFWSFSGLVVYGKIYSLLMLGSGSELQLVVSHAISRVNYWYVLWTVLPAFFRYCVLCFCIHHIYKMPLCVSCYGEKKGKAITLEFQLWANVCTLSTFKVG